MLHYTSRFSALNIQYDWGPNGYIAIDYQEYIHSLGDASFGSRVDIYDEKCKDWHKSTYRNTEVGVAQGQLRVNI